MYRLCSQTSGPKLGFTHKRIDFVHKIIGRVQKLQGPLSYMEGRSKETSLTFLGFTVRDYGKQLPYTKTNMMIVCMKLS